MYRDRPGAMQTGSLWRYSQNSLILWSVLFQNVVPDALFFQNASRTMQELLHEVKFWGETPEAPLAYKSAYFHKWFMQLAPPPLPILQIWVPDFVPGKAHSDAASWAGPDCWLSWKQIIQVTSSPNCPSWSDQQLSLGLLQCYTTQVNGERAGSWLEQGLDADSVSLSQFPICHMWELAIPLFSILFTFRGKGDSTRAIFTLYFRLLNLCLF